MFGEAKRMIADTLILAVVGAVLGALTGTVCLVLISIPAIHEWPSGYLIFVIWMGALVGAPLGAFLAPMLGWFVLRRVPVGRSMLYAPLGTLIGSVIALLLGWLITDISKGLGVFYLIGGAVIGFVFTAFVLRAQYSDRDGKNSPKQW